MAAAAFGRLCVETNSRFARISWALAAAFGRLCVETSNISDRAATTTSSRLRAAVC